MPVIFNQDEIPAVEAGSDAFVQTLLDDKTTSNDNVRLQRWRINAGGSMPVVVADTDLTCVQVLDGEVDLDGTQGHHRLSNVQLVVLPPGFSGTLTSKAGAVLLNAEVPDAARFDPAFAVNPPSFGCVDWTEEPVLNAEHDARKRIYFVTPKMFGTKALAGELIIYPPGTEASNHHHEGAEHFQYIIKGSGTVFSNEEPHQIRADDVIYNYERERHYFRCDNEEMLFVEFFVPGEFKTIWADNAPICAWLPTGKNIKGGTPVREIGAHSSEDIEKPADV
jgi:quercetin dioxygenase-like cupin family protein